MSNTKIVKSLEMSLRNNNNGGEASVDGAGVANGAYNATYDTMRILNETRKFPQIIS